MQHFCSPKIIWLCNTAKVWGFLRLPLPGVPWTRTRTLAAIIAYQYKRIITFTKSFLVEVGKQIHTLAYTPVSKIAEIWAGTSTNIRWKPTGLCIDKGTHAGFIAWPVTNEQWPITNSQSPITNHQSPITNNFWAKPMSNQSIRITLKFISFYLQIIHRFSCVSSVWYL